MRVSSALMCACIPMRMRARTRARNEQERQSRHRRDPVPARTCKNDDEDNKDEDEDKGVCLTTLLQLFATLGDACKLAGTCRMLHVRNLSRCMLYATCHGVAQEAVDIGA